MKILAFLKRIFSKVGLGGGSGTINVLPIRTFLGLTDTPSSYSGQAGKILKVKFTSDGVEFGAEQDLSSYAKLDDDAQTIIAEQFKSVGDVAVTYSGAFVSTITIGSRVITFTNNGTNYTAWSDTVDTWTPTYTAEKLTAITVS